MTKIQLTKTPHKSIYYRKVARFACLEYSVIRISIFEFRVYYLYEYA